MEESREVEKARLCAAIEAATAIAEAQNNTLVVALLAQAQSAADCPFEHDVFG